MAGTSVHVVYNNPRWKVEHDGTAGSHHFTKDSAKYAGRSLAKQMNGELIVHDIDGTIGERESYADDPTIAS